MLAPTADPLASPLLPRRARSLAPLAALALALAACTGAGPRGGAARARTPQAPRPALPPEQAACVDAPEIRIGETVRASTAGRRDLFHATCAYGAASPDAVYRFRIAAPSQVTVRVSGAYDTAVHLRRGCLDEDTEFACNDDSPDERHSMVSAYLNPGEYYVFVDGFESNNAGFFTLAVTATPSAPRAAPEGIRRNPMGAGATVTHTPGQSGVQGAVTFAKRTVTPRGLSRATVDRPAPHVAVEALGDGGRVVAQTETDDDGRFRLELPRGATVRVRALTRTAYLGNDIRVVSDPGTERPFEVSTAAFTVAGDETIALRADVGGVEPAGAFNIVAQFVRYLPFIQRAFGRPLPQLFAFWRRGNNRALPQGNITAFLLDYHRHPNSYALQIQGGDPGREDASDSDQFDDPVILHEFSHFVIHSQAGHYSIGGNHPAGELHFPGQALDEGAASAVGCAVAGDSRYWDSAGLEPTGQLIVDDDSERMEMTDRGIGSQTTAQALLWDLIDGADGLQDRDNDGVAIGLSGVLRVYASFRDDPLAFPGIHTVLDRAIELGLLTSAQATRLVRQPVDHGFTYPLPAAERWPVDIPLPGEVRGRVDGQSQPAPSGGRNAPYNGFDAVRAYRIQVARRGMVYIDLTIDGPGTQASGTDLDMQLFTRQLRLVGRSDTETPRESIRQILDPGTYIILVRDGDVAPQLQRVGANGNRADFTLRVRPSTTFQ